ncbi:MAG: hypothetical protein V7603_4655 [Micromonosporaceae bacterium]
MIRAAGGGRAAAAPAAILLDFDGLLCDTERAAFRSWQELYRWLGHEFPPHTWADMCGRSAGAETGLADLAGRLGRPVHPWEHAWRLRRKAELAEQEPLRDGVGELLRAAVERGTPVAVVSSSPREWVHHHLRRLGVLRRLATVVTGEDAARHKPAPDLYLVAVGRLGVAATAAVAFEDSATGVRAAVAAGLCCVAVPSAVGDRDALSGAHLVLDDLTGFDLTRVPVPHGALR